jgi:hypothetical protein
MTKSLSNDVEAPQSLDIDFDDPMYQDDPEQGFYPPSREPSEMLDDGLGCTCFEREDGVLVLADNCPLHGFLTEPPFEEEPYG